MSIRISRFVLGGLIVAAVVLMADRCWAIFDVLEPSKDDWGLKYDVAISPAEGDTMNVVFTLADEGRLKPIYSATVVALSKPDGQGGRSYDVKAPIELKPTQDGKRTGQVQIPKRFVNAAVIRILTQSVDGRRTTSNAAYYDIPLRKFLGH